VRRTPRSASDGAARDPARLEVDQSDAARVERLQVDATIAADAVTYGHPPFVPSSSASGVPVLELVEVTKTYPSEPPVEALRGVSFTVSAGELTAIVGPSGSGKTTLLQLMGTLDHPTSGVARVTGIDVAALPDRELSTLRATRIGFVFQQFFLQEHESVLDNVADGLLYAGVAIDERRTSADDALSKVGLAHRGRARPTQLSGGERQRVAIARALVGSPAIVLADEPTGNLDSTNSQAILALLEDLNAGGATIVVITHEREIASRLQRQIEVLDGRIVGDTLHVRAETRR
jgi:putative ABC transport system ATP-binding protein